MKMLLGLISLVFYFLAVAGDDMAGNNVDPNTIPGKVTKEDNSDLTVGIALGVGTFLLLVAFIIVLIINKIKNRRAAATDTSVENGYSNGKKHTNEEAKIPMENVNTISAQNDVPTDNNQVVVRQQAGEVNSSLAATDTTPEDQRRDNNQSNIRNNVLASSAVVGGASLVNSSDHSPELRERIEDTINNEVIENTPQNLVEEINENRDISYAVVNNSAFVVGADNDLVSEIEPEESKVPTPPPSVDYLESVEHERTNEYLEELREGRIEDEIRNQADEVPTEDDLREFANDQIPSSQIDAAEIHQNNTADNSYNHTDHVDYDRDDQQQASSAVATSNNEFTSESDYLRSLIPPPLDMDNIVIISKD